MPPHFRHTSRVSPLDPNGFYGWRIVVLAGLALGMTAPGQSVGISVFVDPLLREFAITRTTLSALYLIGTLGAATALPSIGRLLDVWGARRTMATVAASFGLALIAASRANGVVTLTVTFLALRMLGAGALTLTASTSVAYWFERRRGTAAGVTSATGQALISLAPIALAATIATVGWRHAWVFAGGAVLIVLVPATGLFMRDRPAQLGQRPDGDHRGPRTTSGAVAMAGMSRREALRTGMFWVVLGTVASTAMIVTGLTFHQISILTGRGFTPVQAAAIFPPITAAGIASTFAFGWLADRVSPLWLIVSALFSLGGGMVAVQHVTPGAGALLYAGLIGMAGGATRTLEGSVVPNVFGVRHIGSIRGTLMTAAVAASAFGPVAIAMGSDRLAGYGATLDALLLLPAIVVLGTILVRTTPRGVPR